MKLAYMAATPEIKNPKALGYHGDMGMSCALIKELGYDGVELTMANPDEVDVDSILSIARRLGLDIPMICTGEVFGRDGLGLALPDEANRREALGRIKSIIRVAARSGAQVNIGRSRGHYVEGVPREQTEEWARTAFSELARFAGDLGVTLALEPIAFNVCNFINSTQEGIYWVRSIDMPSFRMMVDVYHMNIDDETSIAQSIALAFNYITYVHLCDTNRKPPGWAHMDFEMVIQALCEAGYTGWVSAEVFNFPDQDHAIRRSIEILGPLVRRVNMRV